MLFSSLFIFFEPSITILFYLRLVQAFILDNSCDVRAALSKLNFFISKVAFDQLYFLLHDSEVRLI